MEGAVEFLKEMLRLKSVNPPGDEEPVARLVESLLKDHGIEVVVKNLGENRAYLVARLKGTGKKKSLVFTGHLDTVPPGEIEWQFDPYAAIEHEGRIYGRGASDMKGGLAAMAWAMLELAQAGRSLDGDLVLAATAGEEVDCLGAKAMVADGLLQGVGEFKLQGVRYFTDASVFSVAIGGELPVVIWGPGDEKLAHQPNEYVELEKFQRAISFYKHLAATYLDS